MSNKKSALEQLRDRDSSVMANKSVNTIQNAILELAERLEALEKLLQPIVATNLEDFQRQIDVIRAKKNDK